MLAAGSRRQLLFNVSPDLDRHHPFAMKYANGASHQKDRSALVCYFHYFRLISPWRHVADEIAKDSSAQILSQQKTASKFVMF